MSFLDMFYSPELKPYRDLRRANSGRMAVLVEMKKGKNRDAFQTVLVARSMGELKKHISTLHRIQVIMCVRFDERGEPADKNRCYLKYEPLRWRFREAGGSIENIDTGEQLPLTDSIEL